MTQEMIEMYKKLNTNEKRNELSALLIKLGQLIDGLVIKNEVDYHDFPNIKNYDSLEDVMKTEDEMLLFIYEDIWNIKTKVLALLSKDEQ